MIYSEKKKILLWLNFPSTLAVSYADVKASILSPPLITHQFSCCTCFEMKGTMSESYTQSSPSNSQLKMINQSIYWPLLTFWRLIDIHINNNKMCPCAAWDKDDSTFVSNETKALLMLLSKVIIIGCWCVHQLIMQETALPFWSYCNITSFSFWSF